MSQALDVEGSSVEFTAVIELSVYIVAVAVQCLCGDRVLRLGRR